MSVNHHTAAFISTYTADESGVCSALYELGGMTVIHDASGCNTTYNTHDEPRWYDMDSLVFISAMTEIEAIMGDESRWVSDVIRTARELKPAFIALCTSPIPTIIGTDLEAVANEIERKTGTMTFGIPTNGMHSYISGAGSAFRMVAERLVDEGQPDHSSEGISVNILGMTPLDFSICGAEKEIRGELEKEAFQVQSCWAMGDELSRIRHAARADTNLVVSETGLKAAITLKERFGTPYVLGTPFGGRQTAALMESIRTAASNGESQGLKPARKESPVVIIGEGIQAVSLADAVEADFGIRPQVLHAAEPDGEVEQAVICAQDEKELKPYLEKARVIIADPLYLPVCPGHAIFIEWPHEAFSGRIFRNRILSPAVFYQKISGQLRVVFKKSLC